jgi:hypothetical protein
LSIRPLRLPRWLPLVLLLIAIEATYVFIISAGTWSTWPTWNTNYDLLAEGFRAGHLYIPVPPPAELLSKPNPFDWGNSYLWFLDASLYKGHYYLYWGPFPALVLLAVKIVFRMKATVGDQYVIFLAYTLFLVTGALLITRMARRLFPYRPRGMVLVAIVAFAYAMPTPYMVATPGIYEAAIAAAQALLLLGLVFAFDVVWAASESRPSRWRLLAAGAAWGAAIATRVSAVLPVGVFVLLTAALASTAIEPSARRQRWRRFLASAAWTGGPVALTLAALCVYNKLRFDSWTEVGVKYQLNTFPFITGKAFVPLNIFSYLFRPLGLSCRFPFLSAIYWIGERGFPHWLRFPAGYSTVEPASGLLLTSPFAWLALPALVLAVRALVRWARSPARGFVFDQRQRAQIFCVVSFLALATLMPLVFIAAFDATMRYQGDLSTGTMLLAVWGAWSLFSELRGRWPRRALVAALILLTAVTVLIGGLLGFQGYDDMFKNHNPALYAALRHYKLASCH